MSDSQATIERPDIENANLPRDLSAADAHLNRLFLEDVEEPWYREFINNLRDTFNPPKLPPLDVTSKPIPVKSIWGLYAPDRKNWGYASLVVAGVLVLLGTVFSARMIQKAKKDNLSLVDANLKPYIPAMKPSKDQLAGGGGGGDRSPTPASKGKLPKIAMKQFVPPAVVLHNEHPKLTMTPTIVAPPDAPLPNVAALNLGNPLSNIAEASNGVGSGGGIGSGNRGGIGPGSGAGFGPGSGGGFGGGAFRVGGGVSPPELLQKVEPEYSEEARKAKQQGTVVLQVVVGIDGRVHDVKITRPLGLGLDEKAIEAVKRWSFRPGRKEGKAVAVIANIEVNFHLL